MKIRCKECGHAEEVNFALFVKIIGATVVGGGYWAWVAYIFAGTGFAMPICIAIVLGGVAIAAFSEQITKWIIAKNYPCEKRKSSKWEAVIE